MALKTTIGPNGVVTETIAGSQDQLVVNVENSRDTVRTVVSASATVSLDLGTTTMLIAPAAAGVTCSLPELNTSSAGQQITLLLDDNGEEVLVSGSNPVNSDATLATSGAFGVLELVGVKSDNEGSWHWHILQQRQ
jgi:hypothetical protein